MIVLVVQVLLGFECRAAFEPSFERLPAAAQAMKIISFGLLVVALALLLGIPAFHRVAENGESTPRVEIYLRRMMTYALWPFALALDIIDRLRLFSDTAQPQKNMDEKPEPTPLRRRSNKLA